MNRKFLIAATLLSVGLTGGAQASGVRVDTLGSFADSGEGSLHYADDQNIYHNPAYINSYKNSAGIDGDEIAFFNELNGKNLVYGIGFGRDNQTLSNGIAGIATRDQGAGASATTGALTQIRTTEAATANTDASGLSNDMVEFFIGGDAGIQWGVSYSMLHSSEEDVDGDGGGNYQAKQLNLGVNFGMVDFWVNYQISANATESSDFVDSVTATGITDPITLKGEDLVKVGLKGNIGDWTAFLTFDTQEYNIDKKSVLDADRNSAKHTQFKLGAGRTSEVAEGIRMIFGAAFEYDKLEVQDTQTIGHEETTLEIKSQLGFEAMVASWLTLRAGAVANLMSRTDVENTTSGNNVDEVSRTNNAIAPNVGGTFEFGRLKADFRYINNGTNFDFGSTAGNGIFHIGELALGYSW